MAEGCPAKCAKFLLIIFNIILFLSGAALLAVGIWLVVDPGAPNYFIIFAEDHNRYFTYALYVIIAVGAFTLITGLVGWCGIIKESPCLLGVYIFLMFIIMLVGIVAGILAFVFRNRNEMELDTNLSRTLQTQKYTSGKDEQNKIVYSAFGTGMNLFQQEFKCCGINGSEDYAVPINKEVFDNISGIPYGCCDLTKPDNRLSPQKEDILGGKCQQFEEGCRETLERWFKINTLLLIGLAIGIACLQVFGIIFAGCLCRNPSLEKET